MCTWKHSISVWSQNGRRFDHVHLQVAALVEITKKRKERRRVDRMFPHIGLKAQSICTNQQYRCACAHRRRTSERCWFSFREKVGMFTNLTWFSTTCCEVNLSYRVSGPSQRTRQGASWSFKLHVVNCTMTLSYQGFWGQEDRLPTLCPSGKQDGELQPVTQCHAIVDLLEPCSRFTVLSLKTALDY